MNPNSAVHDELEARIRLARERMDRLAYENGVPRPPRWVEWFMLPRDVACLFIQGARLIIGEIVMTARAWLA